MKKIIGLSMVAPILFSIFAYAKDEVFDAAKKAPVREMVKYIIEYSKIYAAKTCKKSNTGEHARALIKILKDKKSLEFTSDENKRIDLAEAAMMAATTASNFNNDDKCARGYKKAAELLQKITEEPAAAVKTPSDVSSAAEPNAGTK